MSLFRLVAKLGIDSTEFHAGLKKAESGVVGSMAAIGKHIAGAFSVGAVVAFTQAAARAAGEVADLADQLQVTTDEVQQLKKAADQSGVSFDKYANALSKIRKLKADFAAGDASARGVFSRTGLDPNADSLSLLKQIGGLPDAQAFEILDAKSAKLKNSLSEIKALGPLELIRERDIRAIDRAQDLMGDMMRVANALAASGIGENLRTPFLLLDIAKAFAAQDQSVASSAALKIPKRIKDMPDGFTMAGRSDVMVGPEEGAGPFSTLNDLASIRANRRFSPIDMGDRANVGGFFGPNADMNRNMQRTLVSMETAIKVIQKVVVDVATK